VYIAVREPSDSPQGLSRGYRSRRPTSLPPSSPRYSFTPFCPQLDELQPMPKDVKRSTFTQQPTIPWSSLLQCTSRPYRTLQLSNRVKETRKFYGFYRDYTSVNRGAHQTVHEFFCCYSHLGFYTILPSPIVFDVWHTEGGSVGGGV